MHTTTPRAGRRRSRLPVGRLTLIAASTLAPVATGEIESDLDELVVSAIRTPLDVGRVTASLTLLDPVDLEARGIRSLQEALNEAPGVVATSTSGHAGAIGSLLIRGTTTAYSQVVVDGIRLSDATAPLGNFLGGARIDDFDRIEVLRGPQAAIHGGEAVGGVVWMETARGSGDPAGRLSAEAGSFDSFYVHASHRGAAGPLAWFVAAGHEQTDNDAPGHSFDQSRAALRAEWAPAADWVVGTTFRATDSRFENPWDFFAPSLDHLDAALATLYAENRGNDDWAARFTGGYYQESYDSDSAFGNYGTDLERVVVSTDHAVRVAARLRLLAGAFYDHTSFQNTIGTEAGRDRWGAYAGFEWTPVDPWTTHAVVRWEDYAAYGEEVTWRAAAAWSHEATGTTARGGVGRAFRAPSYLDLFGSSFGPGNPNLAAESSLGWDLGIEQALGPARAALTWFDNRIKDQIQPFPAPPVNVPGTTTARGLEASLATSWGDADAWSLRAAWTWLDESLAGQPPHTATATLVWSPDPRWALGAGLTYVDARTWGGQPLDDYMLVRLHGRWQVNDHLEFHARIENLFDESYELSRFQFSPVVPGPGRAFYAGITVTW